MKTTTYMQNTDSNELVNAKDQKKETSDIDYIREYVNFLLLGLIFCISVAIVTFDPSDPTSFSINSASIAIKPEVTNTFGPFGASVADWSFQVFGIGAIIFSLVFIAQLLNTFRIPRQKSRFYLRIFGYPQLILCYLGLITLILPKIHFRGIDILTGGILGNTVAHFFVKLLGNNGAMIALSIGAIASLTLCLGILPFVTVSWILSLFSAKRASKFLGAIDENSKTSYSEEIEKNQINNKNLVAKKNYIVIPSIVHSSNIPMVVNKSDLQEILSLFETQKTSNSILDAENQNLREEAVIIQEKLASFGVKGQVVSSFIGPILNIHEFVPEEGIKVNKVLSLQDDLSLALKSKSVFINIHSGKNCLSIEVPAQSRQSVSLREVIDTEEFITSNTSLPIALGKNIDGSNLISDLSLMPHLLIAGSTGAGKSVCINTILLSLMIRNTPAQLRLLLIDPKVLELSNYDDIGHLLMPVITESDKATCALKWAVEEMERRFKLLKSFQVRNLFAYNNEMMKLKQAQSAKDTSAKFEILPSIVIVVDELSDLMMTSSKYIEDYIQRLAQKARAVGIHLILATQRPSVDVLTGIIKINFPCRLSFQVASRYDSRTILESVGAERLLGKGDMLFIPPHSGASTGRIIRAQCAMVSDGEIIAVTNKLRMLYSTMYETEVIKYIERALSEHQKATQGHEYVSNLKSKYNETFGDNPFSNDRKFSEKL